MVGLRLTGGVELEGMCDSSWGDDINDTRSQAAYVLTMGGTALRWKSWKIGEVSRSSTEAEYCAASDAAAEARGFLTYSRNWDTRLIFQ